MQKKSKRTLLSLILSMMLIVAMAFSMTACGDNNQEKPNTEGLSQTGGTEDGVKQEGENGDQILNNVLGEGKTVFQFVVVDKSGNETEYEIHTDKTNVGEALMEVGLLEGEEGPYGLYVKTVAGTTLDYDKDKMYWAFYINGKYAMTGVEATPITEGETYMFKAEKA